MTEKDTTTPKSKEKKRSRLYPRYDLEKAVELIKIADQAGGSVLPEIVAVKMGKTKLNSSFSGRLSAAKQFGLVSPEISKITLTPLAQRLLYPKSEADRKNALMEAFSTPAFYKELIDNYSAKRLPDRTTLGNIVKLEYGIEPNARDVAAANFISSANYAGLIQSGILVMSAENGVASDDDKEVVENPGRQTEYEKKVNSTDQATNDHFYPFGGIRLYIPRNPKYDEAIAKGKLSAAYDELKQLAKDCDDNPPT